MRHTGSPFVCVSKVLKTRMLPPVEKAKAIQLFTWLDKFEESRPETAVAGAIQKKRLNLSKMSAAAFFRFWEAGRDFRTLNLLSPPSPPERTPPLYLSPSPPTIPPRPDPPRPTRRA